MFFPEFIWFLDQLQTDHFVVDFDQSCPQNNFRNVFLVSPSTYSVIYVKCSRVSFSLSSYSKNMRQGRGWALTCFWENIAMVHKWLALREKCPNTEFFVVRIFIYSIRKQENTDQKNSVFGHFLRSVANSKRQNNFKKQLHTVSL